MEGVAGVIGASGCRDNQGLGGAQGWKERKRYNVDLEGQKKNDVYGEGQDQGPYKDGVN